ncbi:DUF222 domain-containing protein [Frankia sp. AgB1.9]|uniref:DUF222 domain-containing protein n=1 Tax=unclassified Frankia TaxID=2632575 RepID=UPI001931CA6E|nr:MULTISPECIES: DUF222 domain-containing protein [unclassified Frankia]MBL7491360.1 DUF222 domain-containing protein [Frankia sp. AgW1.1]MBL7551309.1 DUF222 domain-containing protein [Frankia sp. AgB1.9]MBL7618541.1 DUF222 domain-containing protein [Frankia sp. AgB1.8]
MTDVPDDRAGVSEPGIPRESGDASARPDRPGAATSDGDQARPNEEASSEGRLPGLDGAELAESALAAGGGDDPTYPGWAPPNPRLPTEPERLSDIDLATAVIEGRTTVDATTARWILLLGEFDRRSLWLADGAVSPTAWLRRECRINAPTSTNLITVARALRDLPATRAAFTTGTISFDHVRAIAPALGDGRLDLARRADPIFARAAAWMTPRQVARVVSTWTDIADA